MDVDRAVEHAGPSSAPCPPVPERAQASSETQRHRHGIADPLRDLQLRGWVLRIGKEVVGVGEALQSGRLPGRQGSTQRGVDVPASTRGHESRGERRGRSVGVEPAVSPSAGLTPRPESPTSAPTAAGLSQQEGDAGLIYLRDGTVYRLAKEGEQPVGAIPPDAGHLALSPGYLAYVHGATIGVLDLPTGATRDLVNVGQRSGQDLALGWLADGATLAYAVAWREPDGSRFVELSLSLIHISEPTRPY